MNVQELQEKYGVGSPVSVITVNATEMQAGDISAKKVTSGSIPHGFVLSVHRPPLTLKEAAEILDMKPDALRRKAAQHGGVKHGRFWAFPTIARPEEN